MTAGAARTAARGSAAGAAHSTAPAASRASTNGRAASAGRTTRNVAPRSKYRALSDKSPQVCWPNIMRLAKDRYEVGGIGFEKLSIWILEEHGVNVSATSLRFWAHANGWRVLSRKLAARLAKHVAQDEKMLNTIASREADKLRGARRRCQTCLAIYTGEHDCAVHP
jgi:hypothetical protein